MRWLRSGSRLGRRSGLRRQSLRWLRSGSRLGRRSGLRRQSLRWLRSRGRLGRRSGLRRQTLRWLRSGSRLGRRSGLSQRSLRWLRSGSRLRRGVESFEPLPCLLTLLLGQTWQEPHPIAVDLTVRNHTTCCIDKFNLVMLNQLIYII